MPHAAFFGLSVVMMLVFQALSALFALIETGTEPLSRNFLSLSSEPAWGEGRMLAGVPCLSVHDVPHACASPSCVPPQTAAILC